MLILENISFQTAKKTFNNSSKKKIKFSIDDKLINSKTTARIRSQTLAQWSETIPLPLFYNKEYRFEIFQEYKFGYNPEDMAVAMGRIEFNQSDRFGTWEVTSQRGNKLGFLSANIRRKLRYSPQANTDMPQSQIVTVSSIIAHISDLKQKRGYVVLTVMGRQFSTQLSKSKSGQLLFTQTLQIQKTDEVADASLQVFSYDAKQDKSHLVATGMLKFGSQSPQKRVVVKNDKHAVAGDVFVDYTITQKDVYNASKQLTRIVHHQQRKAKMTQSRLDKSLNLQASRTLNLSRNFGEYPSRVPRDKKQRVSVVNHNTKIFMPTQRRFQQYRDRQNNNVSYLKDRDSFDFLNNHAKVYYRGASIGKGQKSDFTSLQKSTPGVGGYNLPSIWDRY